MKNSKKLLFLMFVIGFIGLFVGSFSYYRKVVSGSLVTNAGKAVFVLRDTVDGESWNNKVIDLGNINPGDSGSFDVVMDASGSDVDMYATLEIERSNLPSNLKFYTTADHKSELHKYYSFLEKNGTNKESLTLYWYWNPYLDDFDDANYMNKSISANITVSAVQIGEYRTMYNIFSSSPGSDKKFWDDNYRSYIRTINFGNDLSNMPSSCNGKEDLCWDISQEYNLAQGEGVYGYLTDTGLKDKNDNTKPLYDLYIVSKYKIFAPRNCYYIFTFWNIKDDEYYSNLNEINFNGNFNTSNVTNMDKMFGGCVSLKSLDLSDFNTKNVGNMINMFASCSSLTSLDLSNFNTSNLTEIGGIFSQCSSLTNLNLSSFNTTKVTDIGGMFYECSSLTNLDLSSFNTSNVNDITRLFYNCSSLTNINLKGFNTENITTMYEAFSGCSSLKTINLNNFNTAKVTIMGNMFYGCSSLTNLDLSSFNTANVTDMYYMFYNCSSLTNLDLRSFNTRNVINMLGMFYGCSSLTNLDLSSFNTANVTSMYYMFYNCSSLTTTINILNANVNGYSKMFLNSATKSGSQITVNYIASASTLVDNMIATKSSNSNVIKGSIIPEYSITISGNEDIKYETINRAKGTKVTLTSITGNSYVTSFKMNGTTINGNEFIMPDTDVTITDIVAPACKTVESAHNPYPDSQDNVILGEHTFEGAKSLTVILDYQTEGTSYDYFLIYDSSTSTTGINNSKKYGGKTRTQETITINSNYIKITFKSDSSGNNYYGLKAIIIPNY